jgi:hypothetical protein
MDQISNLKMLMALQCLSDSEEKAAGLAEEVGEGVALVAEEEEEEEEEGKLPCVLYKK